MVPKVTICDTQSAPYFCFGHRHAFGVEEALEQQLVAQRVEAGDAERIGDQRARARAAPRADGDGVPLRPVDEVGDDEEVAGEPHLDDGPGLELETRAILALDLAPLHLLGKQRREAPLEARRRLLAQVVLDRLAVRGREVRQPALAELELEAAPPRDLDRVLERLREVGEELRHLGLRLEVLRAVEFARPAGVAEDIALRDAHPRLVRAEVARLDELDRVRGDDWQSRALGERDGSAHQGFAARGIDSLHLEVIRAREVRIPLLREGRRRIEVAGGERRAHVARGRPREHDQPLQPAQPFAPRLRAPAPVVLGVRAGKQVAQRQVAGAIAAEQRHAVRRVAIALVGDPKVAADDRLHARGARSLEELDGAEEVGGVRDGERRHGVGRRRPDRGIHPRDAVHDRVLAVQAQVYEAGRSHG